MSKPDSGHFSGTKGANDSMENIPKGWHATGILYDIPILRPDNPNQSLSLLRLSKIPCISYLLYGRNGVFKQLRIFGSDNKPAMDIDYHIKDGSMSLHKHTYINGVRQPEHIELTDEEYTKYKKFLEKGVKK